MESSAKIQKIQRKETLFYIFTLGLLTFLAHYLYFTSFGLYFDDYPQFFAGWGRTGVYGLLDSLWADLKTPWAGRPFGLYYFRISSSIITKLAYVKLGQVLSLPVLYLVGFLFVWCSNVLLYYLLRKRYGVKLAFLASLVYTLYTAHAFKFYLTGTYQWIPAINCILLSWIFYLRDRRIYSYLFFILALLTYEMAILGSCVMPLLKERKWDRASFREALRYYAVLGGIMLFYSLLRFFVFKEKRLTGALSGDIQGLLAKISSSMLLGPLSSLEALFYRPFQSLSEHGLSGYLPMLFVFPILCFALYYCLFRSKKEVSENVQDRTSDDTSQDILKLFIAGLLLLPLSYVFNFYSYYPPSIRGPLAMGGHFSSGFAWSFILGSLLYFIVQKIKQRGMKQAYVILTAFYFTLCVAYLQLFQKAASKNWKMQTEFRKAITSLSPDIGKDTIILWQAPRAYKTKYAGGLTYSNYYLWFFYSFPDAWEIHFWNWKRQQIFPYDPHTTLGSQGLENLDLDNAIFIYGPDSEGKWHRRKYIKIEGRNLRVRTKNKSIFDYEKNLSIPHQILLGQWEYPG